MMSIVTSIDALFSAVVVAVTTTLKLFLNALVVHVGVGADANLARGGDRS